MLFGALGKCPICSGSLRYFEGQYHCHGYASAWSKCSYSTTEPLRIKQKWKIPEGVNNEYLLHVFESKLYIYLMGECLCSPISNLNSYLIISCSGQSLKRRKSLIESFLQCLVNLWLVKLPLPSPRLLIVKDWRT